MPNITMKLITPDKGTVKVTIDDASFVLSQDLEFVPVQQASFVILRQVDQTEVNNTFYVMGTPFNLAMSPNDVVAKVVEILEVPEVGISDPTLVTHDAPPNGECTCLVTCEGTNLSFVKVEST